MLKIRTWIKLGAGLIVLLFMWFLTILFWPKAAPSVETIAKRGLAAPAHRSSVWKGPFDIAQDWIDQGLDGLAEWEKNPLGFRKGHLGQHLRDLRRSKDPKDQAEYRRLIELAKQWHENLLSRYPELRVAYRNVPDDRNALKLLSDLNNRLMNDNLISCFMLPSDLREQLSQKHPWDPKAAQAWLDANRAVVDEFRAICLMPESSIRDFEGDTCANLCWEGQRVLLLDARLAAERGDLAASMESVQAAVAMANHIQGSEAPTFTQSWIAGALLGQTRTEVFETILPGIPTEQTDLTAWETLLKPTLQTPADFARTMRGDWNVVMREFILPALADPGENSSPVDTDQFVEAYTGFYLKSIDTNTPLVLTDLPCHPNPTFNPSGLSWRSRQLSEMMRYPYRALWEEQQINTGLTQAAFAILKGQPVPNDPIYGKPYSWNPETRELSPPAGPEFSKMGIRPIKLPKL